MQIQKEIINPTKLKLTITADQQLLDKVKQQVLKSLSINVKLQGFRPGKAPLHLVEKAVDQSQLQSDFLEAAVNELYVTAVDQQRLRPVSQPQISIAKFVPFNDLEINAEVDAVGAIKLPDYTKVSVKRKLVKVTEAQVNEVIGRLQTRAAIKEAVKRAAKLGDEVILDFFGTDANTKEPISGADGKDYPLLLGSGSFIPGFEDALVGLKAGDTKDIPLTFPKDYNAVALQNKQVNFAATIHKVNKMTEPKLDDNFVASIGPFKTVAELKTDIRRELEQQQSQENERQFENDILEKIASETEVAIPESLIDDEVERLEQQERQNTAYQGQTWQEHLDAEGVTADEHKAKNKPGAEMRVKAGLVLGEIAEKENITATTDELDIRLKLLKGQYTDETMQSELDKPENRRDIMSRLLTEKTLDKLKSFAKPI